MLSARFLSAVCRRRFFGLLAAVAAVALGAPPAWAFRVNYSPFSQDVEGNMPYTQSVTFTISAPIDLQASAAITFNVVPTGIPTVDGVPIVDVATAKTYVSVSPSPVTFTPLARTQNVSVTFSVPRFPNVVPGTELRFSYNIFTVGWDGKVTAPVTDAGMSINAKVTAPPPANNAPPVVSITTPADGTIFTYPVGGVPSTIPMKFVANTSSPEQIVAIGATIAKQGVEPPQELTLFNKTGIGTLEASAESHMPISGPGVYTITAHGSNSKGVAETTSKFTVRVDGPPPAVVINTPAAGSVYDLVYGSTLNIPFSTTGNAPVNTTIRTLEAKLYLNDGPTGVDIVLSSTGMFTTSANGTANLAITQTGTHRLWARTTNEYGEAVTSHTFTVRKAKAPLTVKADDKTKVYGTVNPTLTHTITGFVNGETLATSDITGAPALATNATQFSPVQPPPPPGNAGAYPITSALGTLTSENYTFIFVGGALTITPAELTVKPNAGTKAYGAPMPSLLSLGYVITGFVGTDTISVVSGVPTLATTATTTSIPGNYPLSASLGTLKADNYTFKFEPNVFTVTKVDLIFTALNASKLYGEANPSFSYTVSGFVNGDTDGASSYSGGPVVLSSTATVASPVSGATYPITFNSGALSSTKYNLSFNPGVLTIKPRPLTLTADNKTKGEGQANPPLTYTASGFVNGDTIAIFSKPPTLSTTATTDSSAGSYPIAIGPGSPAMVAPNYTLNFVHGTLTVNGPTGGTFTVSGLAFFDHDLDGTIDGPDFGLCNVTIKLYTAGSPDVYVTSKTTDASGNYAFTSLQPGTYRLVAAAPQGLKPSPTLSLTRTITLTNASSTGNLFGFGLDFDTIRGARASGFTIGYWKKNIDKKGQQVSYANLVAYTNAIADFALEPFDNITMSQASAVMSNNSSKAADLLAKQLLASEYNYQNKAYLNGNQLLTFLFVSWGEYVLKGARATPAQFSSDYVIRVKDWFDAYNNTHGGALVGPANP